MALIPFNALNLPGMGGAIELDELKAQTSKTWGIDWRLNKITGMVDGEQAIEQAIYMIIHTQRFDFLPVSWNYGFEMDKLIGKDEDILRSECKRLITEALTADDRIEAVEDFKINHVRGRSAEIEFTAVTAVGRIDIKQEVRV